MQGQVDQQRGSLPDLPGKHGRVGAGHESRRATRRDMPSSAGLADLRRPAMPSSVRRWRDPSRSPSASPRRARTARWTRAWPRWAGARVPGRSIPRSCRPICRRRRPRWLHRLRNRPHIISHLVRPADARSAPARARRERARQARLDRLRPDRAPGHRVACVGGLWQRQPLTPRVVDRSAADDHWNHPAGIRAALGYSRLVGERAHGGANRGAIGVPSARTSRELGPVSRTVTRGRSFFCAPRAIRSRSGRDRADAHSQASSCSPRAGRLGHVRRSNPGNPGGPHGRKVRDRSCALEHGEPCRSPSQLAALGLGLGSATQAQAMASSTRFPGSLRLMTTRPAANTWLRRFRTVIMPRTTSATPTKQLRRLQRPLAAACSAVTVCSITATAMAMACDGDGRLRLGPRRLRPQRRLGLRRARLLRRDELRNSGSSTSMAADRLTAVPARRATQPPSAARQRRPAPIPSGQVGCGQAGCNDRRQALAPRPFGGHSGSGLCGDPGCGIGFGHGHGNGNGLGDGQGGCGFCGGKGCSHCLGKRRTSARCCTESSRRWQPGFTTQDEVVRRPRRTGSA